MSGALRIAPADARNQTAQDAPGTTNGTWGDLQVYPDFGLSRMINEVVSASTHE